MIVLRNAKVLAPAPLGRRDIVIGGETILAIAAPGIELGGLEVAEHDCAGLTATPGFIDHHVHVLGGAAGSASPAGRPSCRPASSPGSAPPP